MPYVSPLNASWNVKVPWAQIRGTRLTTSSKWGFNKTSGVSNQKLKSAVKSGVKGKRIVVARGAWSPVRAYSRTALLVSLSGGEGFMNGITIDQSTKTLLLSGLPLQSPVDPTQLFSGQAAASSGLISGGLPVLDTNTRNRLQTETMIKIGDRQASFGSTIAEGRSTFRFIASTALTVLRAYRAVKHLQFSKALKLLRLTGKHIWSAKAPAQRWLELQYAWKPMLADIYSAHRVLNEGVTRKNNILHAKRTIRDNGSYEYATIYTKLQGNVQVSHRCKMWYRMSDATVDGLSRLGLINPLEVAWDIVPFSFVVDWFIPVGSVLEAYSSTLGLTYIDGVISSVATVAANGQHYHMDGWAYYTDGNRFNWHVDYYCFRRSVAFATPSLYVKSPFSSTHAVSFLALLRQLRR